VIPCAEFEALLLDYPELDAGSRARAAAHAAACAACRAFLAAQLEADRALTAYFAGAHAPAALRTAVRARIERPSPFPEILDFLGWSALSAAAAALAAAFAPSPAPAITAAVIAASLAFGLRSAIDLES